MKAKIKVDGTHMGEPMTVDIEMIFDRGEYLSVVKEIPMMVKAIKSISESIEEDDTITND